MPSPTRRSTRSVLPSASKTPHSNSSTSSISSRPERSTRGGRTSPPPTTNPVIKSQDNASDAEENTSDETRCICGNADYPGPPATDENKTLGEDSGSFFLQCDKCSVWQHGGCVGIMDEDKTPEDYFCEQCDKRLHHLHVDQKGQRYSLYLPINRAVQAMARRSSSTRENDSKLRRERDQLTRLQAELSVSKRRSTMNSRQNYEEEEMLRRAIEQSKGDADTGSRKGKRGRDELDEYETLDAGLAPVADGSSVKVDIKRQRTGSESLDAGSTIDPGSFDADSDDDTPTTKSAIKRARAAAAETQRQREMREREKAREQQREEAAGRRQARAGRRRADEDDDPKSDNLPKADSADPSPQPPSPPEIEVTLPSSSHKKSAGRKGKRLGRNQYSKDRAASPTHSKAGSSSPEQDAPPTSTGPKALDAAADNKPSPSSTGADLPPPLAAASHKAKPKSHKRGMAATAAATAATKTSDSSGSEKGRRTNGVAKDGAGIEDMERATGYMLDWIGRNKSYAVQRAGRSPGGLQGQGQGQGQGLVSLVSGVGDGGQTRLGDGENNGPVGGVQDGPGQGDVPGGGEESRDARLRLFKRLSTLEQMDAVLSGVESWRGEFGTETRGQGRDRGLLGHGLGGGQGVAMGLGVGLGTGLGTGLGMEKGEVGLGLGV